MEDTVIYKIYRLFGAGMNYYGSTNQPIYERKASHKQQYKNNRVCCVSKYIMEACDDWEIEIVETLPANTAKNIVLLREKWWIDNNECVNINSPVPKTPEELREYKRIWAAKDRREKGIPIRKPQDKEVIRKKHNDARKLKRLNWTDEERAEINKKKRENRPIQTEEQKERARERARKQREKTTQV